MLTSAIGALTSTCREEWILHLQNVLQQVNSTVVVSQPINVIKLLHLIVLKYIHSKLYVICYEWPVLVRVYDVVCLTVTELCKYIYYVAALPYNTAYTRAIFFKVRSITKLEPQWESDELCADDLRYIFSMPIDCDTSHFSVLST